MYYNKLESYKNKITSCKSFNIKVFDIDGREFMSSPIPIECYKEVSEEIELVMTEGTNWSIWDHLNAKLVMFGVGTIKRIELVFN